MNIQAEKLEILKLILETDNHGIISSIKAILVFLISHDLLPFLFLKLVDQ
jgi:hypothetical protein